MEARGRLREAWGGWSCPGLLRGGSRDPGQAISAEIPRKALGELWASINSVCQPSGNRALKCSCYSPECLEPALGKQGSGGEGCFLLPGSVTGAGGMWGGFLPGDMAAFPPGAGRLDAGLWPGCPDAGWPLNASQMCVLPQRRPLPAPLPAKLRGWDAPCAPAALPGEPGALGELWGCEGSAGPEMLSTPPPLHRGARGHSPVPSLPAVSIRPSGWSCSCSALGHMLSQALAACWRARI